jgi:hypothetical protein
MKQRFYDNGMVLIRLNMGQNEYHIELFNNRLGLAMEPF